MATLQEKIRDLEAEIEEYRDMLKAATTSKEKSEIRNLITETRKTLNILLQQQQAQTGGGQDDFTSMLGASFYIHFDTFRGNAVAVTETKALTALHGKCSVGDEVTLVDSSGRKRRATVIYSQFAELQVDIAVVEVCAGENVFSIFIPVCAEQVHLLQQIFIIGMKPDLSDRESSMYASSGQVTYIEPSVPLFRSAYPCQDGLSGAGVIATVEGGKYHVVGVHVASHDDTKAPPPIKKKKGGVASADSVSESNQSLSDSIHGHTSFSLICEVKRVVGIDAAI